MGRLFRRVYVSTMHSPTGPKESPPDIKLRNPSDLVDQFLFFVCAFPLIPHRAILCFPVRVASHRKRHNLNGWLMTRCCVSHFNLLTVNFRNAIFITEVPNTLLAFRIPFDSTSKLERTMFRSEANTTSCLPPTETGAYGLTGVYGLTKNCSPIRHEGELERLGKTQTPRATWSPRPSVIQRPWF